MAGNAVAEKYGNGGEKNALRQMLINERGGPAFLRTLRMPRPGDIADIQPQLTPQEQRLWDHHLYNLNNVGTGGYRHPTGEISTVQQMVVTGPDGRFYNIPSTWGGRQLSPEDSVRMIMERGGWDAWPSYETGEEAQDRYGLMHLYME